MDVMKFFKDKVRIREVASSDAENFKRSAKYKNYRELNLKIKLHGTNYGYGLLRFLLRMLIMLAVLGYAVHPLGLVWLGVFLLIQLVMTTGLALAFAAVQAFIRDFEQFLSQALSVLFYLTPILYPISMVPSPFREVMDFNPLVHVIEPMRQALLFGTTPSWLNLAGMIVFAALTFWTGRKLFNRLSPHFEDVT